MGKLPKFTIIIKDTDYHLRTVCGDYYPMRTDDALTARIRWNFLHLYCQRSWTVFDNPISRAEAVLSLIYAHPDYFLIKEYSRGWARRITKLTAPHEFEVIDERTDPEPSSKGEWVYDMAHGSYELRAVINPTLLGD